MMMQELIDNDKIAAVNVFQGELKDIDFLCNDDFLEAPKNCYYELAKWLGQKAIASKVDQPGLSHVLAFLEGICYIHLKYDDREEPYSPCWVFGNKRSLIPLDLKTNDFQALILLAEKVKFPIIAARLNDCIWESRILGKKSHESAKRAIDCYLETSRNLCDEVNWYNSRDLIVRALMLSRSVADIERQKSCCDVLNFLLDKSIGFTKKGSLARILDVFVYHRISITLDRLEKIECEAEIMEGQNLFDLAKDIYCSVAEIWKRTGNEVARIRCIEKAARVLAVHATMRANSEKPEMLAACGLLSEGIILLTSINRKSSDLENWKVTLCSYQRELKNEYAMVSTEIDGKEQIQAAIKHVSGYSIRDAIVRFAFGHPLVTIETLKEGDAIFNNNHSFLGVLPKQYVDSNTGRSLAFSSGGAITEEDKRRLAMIRNATQFDWPVRAKTYIQPAWQVLFNEHHPSFADIIPIVSSSAFIPDGFREIYLRGLYAGFQGDFFLSTSILSLQIENSLRYILETQGKYSRVIEPDKTESLMMLEPLLKRLEIIQCLGESMVFELEGHLAKEGAGYNLRHLVAHGGLPYDDFFSLAGMSLWWLVLRLCLYSNEGELKSS